MTLNICPMALKGLEDVEAAMDCLKADGDLVDAHKLWRVGDHDRRYGKASNDLARFDAMEATKRRLQHAKEALETLTRSLDGCLADVRQTLDELPPFSLMRGMRNVPNEILAMIFDRVYDASCEESVPGSERGVRADSDSDSDSDPDPVEDDWDGAPRRTCDITLRTVLRLAHVSRRCRAIVLRLPRLWSRISMAYKPAAVDFLLARSGRTAGAGAGLTVVLPLTTPLARQRGTFLSACAGFLKKLLPHAWRIRDMQFCLNEDETCWAIDPTQVFAALKKDWFGIDLPNLATLSVYMPFNLLDDDDEFDEEFNVDIRDFYASWNVPSLRRLDFRNFTPTLVTPVSVTHCVIEATDNQDFNLHALAQFLRVSSMTERLSLKLRDCRPLLHEESTIHMPNLISLTIDVWLDDAFPTIFEKLEMRKLKTLSVALRLRCESDFEKLQDDERLKSFFPHLFKEGSTVTSLRIIIRKHVRLDENLDGAYLAKFLSELPMLDELYVQAPLTLLPASSYLPKLTIRRLRLKNCDMFPVTFFRRTTELMCRRSSGVSQTQQAFDELEEVEIENCPSMERGELEQLLGGKRLIWIPKAKGAQSSAL